MYLVVSSFNLKNDALQVGMNISKKRQSTSQNIVHCLYPESKKFKYIPVSDAWVQPWISKQLHYFTDSNGVSNQ